MAEEYTQDYLIKQILMDIAIWIWVLADNTVLKEWPIKWK